MKIGIIQLDIVLGKPSENIKNVEILANKLFSIDSPDVVVLPELWPTGYSYETLNENAFTHEDVVELLERWTERFPALWIPGSFPIREKGNIYNRAYAFSKNGKLLVKYDKLHLFGPMSEKKYFTPGKSIEVFEYEDVMFGLAICYDLRFPELFRILTLKGARIIFLPTEWPTSRMVHFNTLIHARAIENQLFMIGVNRVGKDLMSEFSGGSIIVDPWGESICTLEKKEEVKICNIDLSVIDKVRNRLPVLSDRRVDVYEIYEIE